MRSALFVIPILMCSAACATEVPMQNSIDAAWSAWRKGDIEKAEQAAARHAGTDAGRHLLTFCACVKGKYAEAEELYGAIDPSYKELKKLDEAMLQALLHMHRYDDAAKFAKERSMKEAALGAATARAEKPLRASLKKLTRVPYAKHPLAPYFPAFPATINAKKTTVHLDTGGTWLIMGPERAAKLGIELVDAGEGQHGAKKVKLKRGVAASFTLGDATLENVPVVSMPTLTGPQDFVIFGTNVLQEFHSTLNYPNKELLLSPREDKTEIKKQMAVHKGKRTEVPFYMWGDHYMFARGGFGKHRDLNFFVDSGLVALDPSSGKLRQACFTAMPEKYQKWGVKAEKTGRKFFECELPITLGPLEQTKQYFTTTSKTIAADLGGVQIDGLISHAFLKEYVWTLDFDRMRYVFSKPKE